MKPDELDFPIVDAHIHFMTKKTHAESIRLWSRGNQALIEDDIRRRNQHVARQNNPAWGFPDISGVESADMWLSELDKNGISRAVFLCLAPEFPDYEDFIDHGKERFLGFTSVNPLDSAAVSRLDAYMQKSGFVGLKLFPPLQRFYVYDEKAYPLYELAESRGWPIIFHMGLTLSSFADMRYANPLDLQPVARDFSKLNIIVPHFGTGYFQEALFLAYQSPNVYFDTSSSNVWLKYLPYELTLKEVFQKFLSVAGYERIIFGTDSSYFPRGYRTKILHEQLEILETLNLPEEQLKDILGGNILRLLQPDHV